MSNVSSTSELTTKEIVEQAIQDYHSAILPYLAKGNNGYSETPIGAMQMFDDDTTPSGWLVADGTVYDIDDYPFLANHIERVHGSKNYYGGNGTTTFAVPDWQGEFFRASGTNSHTNQGSGAAVGVHQDGTLFGASNLGDNYSNFYEVINDVYANNKYDYKFSNSQSTGFPRSVNSSISMDYGGSLYTSKPTNTSLLCCIKAVPAGINYSLEEQKIGTWIDRKPLYQKTFTGTTGINGNAWTVTGISIPNDIIIQDTSGIKYSPSNDTEQIIPCIVNRNTESNQLTVFNLRNVNYEVAPISITIQYTKTTD